MAAPQIGISKQLITIQVPSNEKDLPFTPLFNPQIQIVGKSVYYSWESCLSIPNLWARVTRADSIIVNFVDYNGNPRKMKAAGFFAALIQHENDHLLGKLFLQQVKPEEFQYVSEDKEFYERFAGTAVASGDFEFMD